jgi:hypothetical protein
MCAVIVAMVVIVLSFMRVRIRDTAMLPETTVDAALSSPSDRFLALFLVLFFSSVIILLYHKYIYSLKHCCKL